MRQSASPKPKNNAGVIQLFVNKPLGAPAITYEMGDESDRDDIRRLAVIAAEEMMKTLLTTDSQECSR